jgi:hypothetical protein
MFQMVRNELNDRSKEILKFFPDIVVEANNSILRAVHSAPRATHSGAPKLRRYATTPALFSLTASLRGVPPHLQHFMVTSALYCTSSRQA